MKKVLFLLLNIGLLTEARSQEDSVSRMRQWVVEEGFRLYRSEMASWYGTDLFLERYNDRGNIGGYFSYEDPQGAVCVFFSAGPQPGVIGAVRFDSTFETGNAKVDLTGRKFSVLEDELYRLRKKALEVINSDTMFRTYKNTSLNLIPLLFNGEKKVYILTGPAESGVVIFGNDYLLQFDQDNKLTMKKTLHQNLIPVYTGQKTEDGNPVTGASHTHLPETGEFITPTDICTLMLYQPFTGWEQHLVVSEHYLSIWNCQSRQLTIVPRGEAVEK